MLLLGCGKIINMEEFRTQGCRNPKWTGLVRRACEREEEEGEEKHATNQLLHHSLVSHDWVAIKKDCHNLSKLMTQWHTSAPGLKDGLTCVESVNSFIIAEIRILALAK